MITLQVREGDKGVDGEEKDRSRVEEAEGEEACFYSWDHVFQSISSLARDVSRLNMDIGRNSGRLVSRENTITTRDNS